MIHSHVANHPNIQNPIILCIWIGLADDDYISAIITAYVSHFLLEKINPYVIFACSINMDKKKKKNQCRNSYLTVHYNFHKKKT